MKKGFIFTKAIFGIEHIGKIYKSKDFIALVYCSYLRICELIQISHNIIFISVIV